jgi:hypothetical protein
MIDEDICLNKLINLITESISINSDIDNNMEIKLDKLNPRFRHLTDLLCFSTSKDLNIGEYKSLYRERHEVHMQYLWNRFCKSSSIFWEEGADFWKSRFSFILGLNDRNLSAKIETFLNSRMLNLLRTKDTVHIDYDIEFLQLREFCKVKYERSEALTTIKESLLSIPSSVAADKVIDIINEFIPSVFASINEYISLTAKRILISSRNFDILVFFEKKGISYDKNYMVNLLYELICERDHYLKNIRASFTLLNNPDIRNLFKQKYDSKCRDKIIDMLRQGGCIFFEEFHMRNCANLLDLDPSLGDDIAVIYAEKLFEKTVSHKKSNADHLIKMLKKFPQISPKKILAYLSAENKMIDMKFILNAFPSLKQLAIFV